MTERLLAPSEVQAQLALVEQNLAYEYPNYPERRQRLVLPAGELAITSYLPDGPWEYSSGKAGELDQDKRPVHPWLPYMIHDENIGVVTGSGAYWYWGPNYTADAVVLHDRKVLLGLRRDTGIWGLPGGHVDIGEAPKEAAIRELREETKIKVTSNDAIGVFYKGPVADPRMTAHAWPETTAVLYKLPHFQQPQAGDDIKKVRWFGIRKALSMQLFGSHNFLLSQALEMESSKV